MGFGVWGLGIEIRMGEVGFTFTKSFDALECSPGFGFGVESSGYGIPGLGGFRLQASGFEGSGFGV